MGHRLDAYIARPEILCGLGSLLPGARMRALAQGLWFAPIPDALRDKAMEDADNDAGGPFLRLVEVLDTIGLKLSERGEVAWIETDWFGGRGGSTARLWRGGAVVIEEAGVNTVLKALGVKCLYEKNELVEGSWLLRAFRKIGYEPIKPRLLDEWDSANLGYYRYTDDCYEGAKPVETFAQGAPSAP